MQVINTLGRRKTAVARVYLSKGKGKITVNNKEAKEVFPIDVLQSKLVQPFVLTDTVGKYNVSVNVSGGGINGQVEAIRLGISRALVEIDAENRVALKVDGLMNI
jgi:small subunit ribosomal protein S9